MVRIVVEGKSDKNFLKNFINFLGFDCSDDNFIVMGNKSSLLDSENNGYSRLKQEIKFGLVDRLLFVVDADNIQNDNIYGGVTNTKNALNSLKYSLDIDKLADFYINSVPGKEEGYLEGLLLSTVDDKLKDCYENFLKCSGLKSKDNYKTVMEELHRLTKPEKPYDFTHPNFNELKQKLQNLFKEEI